MRSTASFFAIGIALMSYGTVRADDAVSFEKVVRPLLADHCFKCHGPEKKKGGVELSSFTDAKSVSRQRKTWRQGTRTGRRWRDAAPARAGIEAGTADDPGQPGSSKRSRPPTATMLPSAIRAARPFAGSTEPSTSALSATCSASISMQTDAVGLRDEPNTKGFDNLADALNMPPALVEKYFAASEKILDQLIILVDTPPTKEQLERQQRAQRNHDAVFFVKPGETLPKREAAKQIISRFVGRAYRRPARDTEIERLLKLFDLADRRGANFDASVRLMLKAVLVNPNFLIRVEAGPPADLKQPYYPVNDYAPCEKPILFGLALNWVHRSI